MKLSAILAFICLGFAQFIFPQTSIQPPRPNEMSNVFGLTFDGGITLAVTDYKFKKVDNTWKGSLEYYLPSTGSGNIGLRVFGQTGFFTGKGSPVIGNYPFNSTNEFSTKFSLIGGGVNFLISIGDVVYPWVGFGISDLWFYPKDGNGNYLPNYSAGAYSKSMLAYNGDIGARFMITKNISLNLSGGVILANKDVLDDIAAGTTNDLSYTFTAGISYYFNRARDSDHDGVPDDKDMCPGTPRGVRVDEFGCPLDADGDGVPDYLDKCPDTPKGVKVDANGCPLDSDGDGVPDYLDKCANTPAGVKVDVNGCPLDSDGDGVPDYLDKCPNTPKGVAVDVNGCPLDSDGDGVPDYLDKCPNTPKGVQVDANGCPIRKAEVIKSFVLQGDANFETGKADLLPSAYPLLDSLYSSMKLNPNLKFAVAGYTDSRGSDELNMRLSEKRAQSIVDYLVSKGLDRNSFVIKPMGKANPIASNKTSEGRAMNRRVEIKLLP